MRVADVFCGLGRHEVCSGYLDRTHFECECVCHEPKPPDSERSTE